MTVLLGCIADDFTGGTDLAGMLVKAGMRTVQLIGVPTEPLPDDIDAVVIALKSRTNPAADAVAESLAALRYLQEAGCKQFYFKYCSTFDSTPTGNIGPVAEALMQALETDFTIACPAFPANGRTIYKGYLFVGNELLSESGMRNHPLTPMTDASLVRVLQQQVSSPVGLADYTVVEQGAAAISERFAALRAQGCRFAIVDAVSNQDLEAIGEACADLPLITGGSGIALGLPENFRRRGLLKRDDAADRLPATGGLRAVIAGSCSVATQRQVAVMREQAPSFHVDALELARGVEVVAAALDWAREHIEQGPVLVYATSTPETVRAVQTQLGVERAGLLVEEALAAIAQGLVRMGVGQLIVAGGETSGAVVKALGVTGLHIGPEIDPGVPWTVGLQAGGTSPLALALKSGNFGSEDFFLKAWSRLS
ncbi:four-carbon acid sugar kinase family protein [Herbaspirillum sp. RTI4]|uniref:3-oxo-tetronate kinase n=1 Tax=Herbaspirillum sp. RTI4 TaxID=3048640 RepID=UPI002AB3D08C|nr:3-oxo-tetronate kinase [Herbaspirillum sp. RTI4]MDY7577179.1 four-carbon acid sugar kinase family protein [Herbaspirillum sp. RTI4]MEA9980469.1 four-carbon acid sugar kinase family protein [Herbaspirillum sp. RTI4]